MTKTWFWSLPWIFILASALQGQSRESLLKTLAQDSSWSPADKPTYYDEKNIQLLAARRAAAVIRYGLIGATQEDWRSPEGNVHLTLYEMVDASAAYGLFTLYRDVDQPGFAPLPIGSEGFRISNRFVFWQSKYVVVLEGGTAAAADTLGRLVSQNIFGRSRKPPVSSHLPPQNLVQGSEKYILDTSGIDREFGLNPQDLGFEDSVEIASGDYRVDGKTAHLLLFLYPTQQVAKKYADRWSEKASETASFRKRVGPLFAVVRGSRNVSVAKAILDGVNYESQVTWSEPRPDLSLREVVLTIFSFIGIALVFTIVAGFSFGGFRIFVKARYPDRVFDRSADMEIIQLKLGQGLIRKELKE